MCRAYYVGDWESDKLSVWTSAKVRECYSGVEREAGGRLSKAQDIVKKSTDFVRRTSAPADRQGGITFSYVCPPCHRHLLEDYIGGTLPGMDRGSAAGAVRPV